MTGDFFLCVAITDSVEVWQIDKILHEKQKYVSVRRQVKFYSDL